MGSIVAIHSELLARKARADIARVRDRVSIVGKATLGEDDLGYFAFASGFEQRFVHQGGQSRDIATTLNLAFDLLGRFPRGHLRRIHQRFLGCRERSPAEAPSSQPCPPRPG